MAQLVFGDSTDLFHLGRVIFAFLAIRDGSLAFDHVLLLLLSHLFQHLGHLLLLSIFSLLEQLRIGDHLQADRRSTKVLSDQLASSCDKIFVLFKIFKCPDVEQVLVERAAVEPRPEDLVRDQNPVVVGLLGLTELHFCQRRNEEVPGEILAISSQGLVRFLERRLVLDKRQRAASAECLDVRLALRRVERRFEVTSDKLLDGCRG